MSDPPLDREEVRDFLTLLQSSQVEDHEEFMRLKAESSSHGDVRSESDSGPVVDEEVEEEDLLADVPFVELTHDMVASWIQRIQAEGSLASLQKLLLCLYVVTRQDSATTAGDSLTSTSFQPSRLPTDGTGSVLPYRVSSPALQLRVVLLALKYSTLLFTRHSTHPEVSLYVRSLSKSIALILQRHQSFLRRFPDQFGFILSFIFPLVPILFPVGPSSSSSSSSMVRTTIPPPPRDSSSSLPPPPPPPPPSGPTDGSMNPTLEVSKYIIRELLRYLKNPFLYRPTTSPDLKTKIFLLLHRITQHLSSSPLSSNLHEYILRGSYVVYLTSCRTYGPKNFTLIHFLRDVVVQLYCVQPTSVSYVHAFLFLRELGISLRNAMVGVGGGNGGGNGRGNKRRRRTNLHRYVFSWKFFHSMDLWTRLVERNPSVFGELSVPITEILMGTIRLKSLSIRFVPLRLKFVNLLVRISRAVKKVIFPSSQFLLEMIPVLFVRSTGVANLGQGGKRKKRRRKKRKKSLGNSSSSSGSNFIDLEFRLEMNEKEFRSSFQFQKIISDELFYLLADQLSIMNRQISFPEVSYPMQRMLKRWSRIMTDREFATRATLLVRAVRESAAVIAKVRSQSQEWEERDVIMSLDEPSPLEVLFKSWKMERTKGKIDRMSRFAPKPVAAVEERLVGKKRKRKRKGNQGPEASESESVPEGERPPPRKRRRKKGGNKKKGGDVVQDLDFGSFFD